MTINDAAEQNWLLSVFGTTQRLWIGLTDTATEGVFNWVSGQAVTYTNWTPGEPNTGSGSYSEDYVAMNWFGTSGQWNDLPDAGPGFRPTRGIVEIEATSEATSVPEPASMAGLLAIGTFGVGSALKRKQSQKA